MSGQADDPGLVRIAVELSEKDVRRIAGMTAALLRSEARSGSRESPYLTIDEAAVYLRCRRQRIDDLPEPRFLHDEGPLPTADHAAEPQRTRDGSSAPRRR